MHVQGVRTAVWTKKSGRRIVGSHINVKLNDYPLVLYLMGALSRLFVVLKGTQSSATRRQRIRMTPVHLLEAEVVFHFVVLFEISSKSCFHGVGLGVVSPS
jgi:hypothetical protein